MVAQMGGKPGGAVNLNPAEHDLPLKEHAAVDGLRYDVKGRLWVPGGHQVECALTRIVARDRA